MRLKYWLLLFPFSFLLSCSEKPQVNDSVKISDLPELKSGDSVWVPVVANGTTYKVKIKAGK